MRFINRGRQTGKTTMMIHSAYTTGYPIIVTNQQRKNCIKQQAQLMKCDDIEIYTIDEWHKFKYAGRDAYYKDINEKRKCFVDETEDLLKKILDEYLDANVIAATMSLEMK